MPSCALRPIVQKRFTCPGGIEPVVRSAKAMAGGSIEGKLAKVSAAIATETEVVLKRREHQRL